MHCIWYWYRFGCWMKVWTRSCCLWMKNQDTWRWIWTIKWSSWYERLIAWQRWGFPCQLLPEHYSPREITLYLWVIHCRSVKFCFVVHVFLSSLSLTWISAKKLNICNKAVIFALIFLHWLFADSSEKEI